MGVLAGCPFDLPDLANIHARQLPVYAKYLCFKSKSLGTDPPTRIRKWAGSQRLRYTDHARREPMKGHDIFCSRAAGSQVIKPLLPFRERHLIRRDTLENLSGWAPCARGIRKFLEQTSSQYLQDALMPANRMSVALISCTNPAVISRADDASRFCSAVPKTIRRCTLLPLGPDSHHRKHHTSGPSFRCSGITLPCCMSSSSLSLRYRIRGALDGTRAFS
jgi:hypothetical protein